MISTDTLISSSNAFLELLEATDLFGGRTDGWECTWLRSLQAIKLMDGTPITFSAQFVITMRKQKRLTHKQCLRTAIAIPKLLTARYFRRKTLQPNDYIEAAVFNTPYEDQAIAERVATEILFPPTPADRRQIINLESLKPDSIGSADDPMASILASLAKPTSVWMISKVLTHFSIRRSPTTRCKAYDLFDKLISSTNPSRRVLENS